MKTEQIIEADLTWFEGRFEPGIQVEVAGDGTIARAGRLGMTTTSRRESQALLPGMINAHSHAFQRALRGQGETFAKESGSFWSWREAMYGLAADLDPDALHTWTTRCFREMRRAGITTVGEFHYLHHKGTSKDFALDEVVLAAARDAGIRIVLLQTHYVNGGVGIPLSARQQRFDTIDVSKYLQQLDRLQSMMRARETAGVVAHSIRGVPIDAMKALYVESKKRDLVFHMHLEEQPQEIADCVTAYHQRPLELVIEHLEPGANFTAVHCTHSIPDQLRQLFANGANVCVTPTTEANLGDGIPTIAPPHALPAQICLGTDSNSRISMIEEMRWLEYGQRLRQQKRGVFIDAGGELGPRLFQSATVGGARSLGVQAGTIAAGLHADFFTIDLTHPSLDGYTTESLMNAMILGTSEEVITATCVGGGWEEHRTTKG
ncbi:MAG TPA: formimidoylglutamate deiminase [Thermoanaerobaculia bacterium]|nr:formimidoylglutamate deiminase [Thermoanaerobaculia bacterium]